MSTLQETSINDPTTAPNSANRQALLHMIQAEAIPADAADQIQKFANDRGDAGFNAQNLDRILEQYPYIVAALIWQSAFYYRPRSAAEVALAFLRDEDTAFEWHFSISAQGRISLKEANDQVVTQAIDNLIHTLIHRPDLESMQQAYQRAIAEQQS